MKTVVELRRVDPTSDMNSTIETHYCPDVDRTLEVVRSLLESGTETDHWIEVSRVWEGSVETDPKPEDLQ